MVTLFGITHRIIIGSIAILQRLTSYLFTMMLMCNQLTVTLIRVLSLYGAYYTTNRGGSVSRINAFPTGVRAYDKYKNVTALVRANIGLFLPISGLRILGNKHMGFRDMTWGAGAYGQYWSSKATGLVKSQCLQVGPTKWTISDVEKGSGICHPPCIGL